MKNYSSVWISGSTNHKTSCVVDHANSDQHKAAMNHMRKASGMPITEYSPVARGLLNMDKAAQDRFNKNLISATLQVVLIITRIKNIKNVTRCRDSRSAKSIETR